jgi:hypothetical protein
VREEIRLRMNKEFESEMKSGNARKIQATQLRPVEPNTHECTTPVFLF